MQETISESLNIFGIRHLSPSAAWHLIKYLDTLKPKCILIEGPSDALEHMRNMADRRVKPPIALMAYTAELPVETILYPFAQYSPEYQAIVWTMKKKADLHFIDLPANISLAIHQQKALKEFKSQDLEEKEKQLTRKESLDDYYQFHNSLYHTLADHFDEEDYESYWERVFEHNLLPDTFRCGLELQSSEIRSMVVDREQKASPEEHSYNLIREAYMRREIAEALCKYKPQEIVIIVGAYHVEGIRSKLAIMSDEELNALPRVDTRMTLMPYSYYRLSSRTGYGAGNKAPYYFDLMWQCMQNDELNQLPAMYLSGIGRELRKTGFNASSASVIEAVRLAASLSSLHQGSLPVLKDLHDAVVTCLGNGDLASVVEAINKADIGTAIGSLPEGLSQTPVQDDMNRQLKQLKLNNYKTLVEQILELDLRENRTVKSKEAAFIDLNRSIFFHRLQLLNIRFALPLAASQADASWREKWVLQWTPEVEIEVVEANLKGESLELAAAFVLKENLETCESIGKAAGLIRTACECNLITSFTGALRVLQELTVEESSFRDTAHAVHELSILLQFGSLRNFDLEPIKPLLQQLFLRACLLLFEATSCDNKAAIGISEGINSLDHVAREHYDLIDEALWLEELKQVAFNDSRNPILSGLAFSVLLERNLIDEEDCSKEVSRRLSPGIPADIGAGWFEGLSGRNRYALLSRLSLWKELDKYVKSLDTEEFHRSVVFLRRAFGTFEANQKNSIAELLGDIWGIGEETAAELLQEELNEKEQEKIDNLNDFDFDDLF